MTEYRDYREMVEAIGVVLLERTDEEYTGDSRYLLRRRRFRDRPPGTFLDDGVKYGDIVEYGYLCFGWGSCSGCDAFLAAKEELPEIAKVKLKELRTGLQESIIWRTADDMRNFILSHDWEGDYNKDPKFIEMATIVMRGLK